MNVQRRIEPIGGMSIKEFFAFAASRPAEERWELIEGVPSLNPSPVDYHQMVCANIAKLLLDQKENSSATWLPLLGVGTRVPASPLSLPVPDLFVKEGSLSGSPETTDALVMIEVLSRSNRPGNLAWRRRVYASIPNCQHYVTVSLKQPRLAAYDRATGWKERKVTDLSASLDLAAIGAVLPLVGVYRYTPIGQ